jgi:hypothetical protein
MERLFRVGGRKAGGDNHTPRQPFNVFPFAVEQQALEVDAGPARRLRLWKIRRELGRVCIEAAEVRDIEWAGGRHWMVPT